MNARRNDSHLLDDEDIGDLGVFAFAKKSALLFVPMGIVATVFGLWLRSELLAVRQDLNTIIATEVRMVRTDMVPRTEFQAFKQIVDDRWITERRATEEQNRMIQRNTIYLERIGQKLSIQRPVE